MFTYIWKDSNQRTQFEIGPPKMSLLLLLLLYDLRKYSFTVRIVNLWNSLPENVISADSVNTFKNRLDKFWSDQELVYDYKADITRIGNRSLISLDDSSV